MVQQNNAAANKTGIIFFILLRVTNRVYCIFIIYFFSNGFEGDEFDCAGKFRLKAGIVRAGNLFTRQIMVIEG